MKRVLSLFLVIVLTLALGPSLHADAATKISKTNATLKVGSKLTLKISGTKSKVTWKSNKTAVATVSSKGVVTAKSAGKAKISAKIDKKTYTCTVTVKKNTDFTGWVPYSTDNINNLIDGISNGNIVYIDGKYYCSPEYFEMFSNEEMYENDATSDSTAAAINKHTLDPNIKLKPEDDDSAEKEAAEKAALDARISAMFKSGAAVVSDEDTETDESSINKANDDFSAVWINETELRNKFQIFIDWVPFDKKIYFSLDDNIIYTLEDIPSSIKVGELYTFSGIRFQYIDSRFYFNRNDLIEKGIIN